MISTFLAAHPWATSVAFVVLVVAGLTVGPWLVPRRRPTLVLLVLAVVAVAVLTLSPSDRDLVVGCVVEWSVPTPGRVEVVANVLLFAPVVLVAGVLTRHPWWSALAASVASVVVEAFQAFVPALGRSCSTDDWFANTIGAVLGAVLAWAALRLARRFERSGDSSAQVNSESSR